MTEAGWLAATGPDALPDFVRLTASDRKLRLLAAACRRVWDWLDEDWGSDESSDSHLLHGMTLSGVGTRTETNCTDSLWRQVSGTGGRDGSFVKVSGTRGRVFASPACQPCRLGGKEDNPGEESRVRKAFPGRAYAQGVVGKQTTPRDRTMPIRLAEALGQVAQNKVAAAVEQTHGEPKARGASIGGTQVHSIRLPGIVLAFETLFGLPNERLTIRHDAGKGAEPYVNGTLLAVRRVREVTGLVRGLDRLLFGT
jgi:hypothetical protein